MKTIKPILGITMGDPCGIGPEITVKALQQKNIYDSCRPVVVGSAAIVRQALDIVKADLKINAISDISDAMFLYGTIDVYDQQNIINPEDVTFGKVNAKGGEAAYQAIAKVIELAMENKVDATITGPLNKEALNLAGHHYSGHTEIYAELTGTRDYCMMLADDNLRVVHVSTHVSLREACDRCKQDRVFRVISLADSVCRSLGIENPRIGVAGLNPHAGENGLFGREEIEEIKPAVNRALSAGILVDGPVPPDTLFSKAAGGQYDIVVAQYHDQGHIPLKLNGFRYDHNTNKWNSISGINITLGLPIIRSAVDHGTAFGKAGKGTANEGSMINAIEYGIALANDRIKKQECSCK